MNRYLTCYLHRLLNVNRKAFTLVELLVVIAIVAILASLLLPSLSHAKASALSVKCKSNLRQIGIALRLYINEDGFYPLTENARTPYSRWARSINTFLNQPLLPKDFIVPDWPLTPYPGGVFLCPGDKRKTHGAGGSYGYNSFGNSGAQFWDINRPPTVPNLGLAGYGVPLRSGEFASATPDSAVIAPANMLAIGDAFSGSTFHESSPGRLNAYETYGDIAREGLIASSQYATTPTSRRLRHRDKLNMLFCDGHVEGLKIKKLYFSKDDADLRLWNNDNEPHRERLNYSLR